jgi:DNA-binding NarL/FixJ family response regulator
MIRLILVDDHCLFREGLCALLENDPEMSVVATAGDAREALRAVAEHPCDLVVLDVTLPDAGGVSVVRDVARLAPERALLVLSMHTHADVVAEAIDGGAGGYALKTQSHHELLQAIRNVAAGERYLAPSLRPLMPRDDGWPVSGGLLSALSPREREVFDLLVRGASNGDIAKHFFISVKTVETHRTRLMKKLGVHNIGELIRLAARHGHLTAA